jgi:uncharacterized membrane protein
MMDAMSVPLENGIIYALMAGLFWGITPLLLKKGMTHSNVSTATLVQQSVIVLTVFIIAVGQGEVLQLDIPLRAVWSFMAAGVVGGSIGKIFYNKAIERVGASKAVSIKNSDPIISVLFLALVLGEELTFPVAIGVALIVTGVLVITRIQAREKDRPNRLVDFIYPLLALLCFGITPLFKKLGMVAAALPTLAAFITQSTALIVILTVGRLLNIRPKWERIPTKSLVCFVSGGITDALGSLFTFYSLIYAPAVVVSPIWRISPLIVFLLARFTLRGVEVVTLKDGIAATFIVSGVLVLGRA